MNITAIIQARMESTRLPGKVLMKLGERSVLAHVIRRLRRSGMISSIVVATTTKEADLPIVDEAARNDAAVFRGSETDVLSRFYHAAKQHEADVVVRITSDCPFIDPEVVDAVISKLINTNSDYASNFVTRTFPRGLDAEAFTFRSLETAHLEAVHLEHREHVTPYLYQNPQRFRIASHTSPDQQSRYRWTLDTAEDWECISGLHSLLHKPLEDVSWREILLLAQRHPEISSLNEHVEQVKLTTGMSSEKQ